MVSAIYHQPDIRGVLTPAETLKVPEDTNTSLLTAAREQGSMLISNYKKQVYKHVGISQREILAQILI